MCSFCRSASGFRDRADQEHKPWIDPKSMPDCGLDVSQVAGNVSDCIKRLISNTFAQYGVGDADCFAYQVGKAVRFVEANVSRREEQIGRHECTTVYEVTVEK